MKFKRYSRYGGIVSFILNTLIVSTLFASLKPVPPRRVLNLDGVWQIAEGLMEQIPKKFERKVAVPGLADMAEPAFEKVGFKNDLREAFWYRRTFTVEGNIPAIALLKIYKAKYGTRVYLNGQLVGDHLPCFTPSYFDVVKFLKGSGAQNELIIRVGAYRESVPRSIPDGWDFEKYRYIPGIYDSVELILTNPPYFQWVQTAPNLADNTIRVEAKLLNPLRRNEIKMQVTVREAKSGKEVFSDIGVIKEIKEYDEFPYSTIIPIENCRLWSPEDPFLYELEIKTDTDAVRMRFGMRSFRFDKKTGRAVLNGKPYIMRGTNVCIYRFFEDDLRGDKPWRNEWIRRLHQKFKSMHWNSIRYCIGFPPEAWYDIADELGILIQDEFPIWYLGKENWPADLKAEQIAKEYTDWMQDRWNHPCVVIWDAQNETVTDETRKAIGIVRGLDLSNRPWDNGWALPQSDQDCLEAHPYLFSKNWKDYWGKDKGFKLADMVNVSAIPPLRSGQTEYKLPIILNEYAWLWLNRDGSTTCLTGSVYEKLLGANSTVEQRREVYAKYLAALTEFWRAHRKCAAVMHFCGLGYSRAGEVPRPEGGATSDHFLDLEKLIFEPHFENYVKDSFAPVGLMIDFWKDQIAPSAQADVPVVVINDICPAWQGTVRLRIEQNGQVVSEQQKQAKVDCLGRKTISFAIQFPSKPDPYQIIAEIAGRDGAPVRSYRDINVKKQ
jgi:beta-galactosidase